VRFVNGSNPVEFDNQMRLIFGGNSEPGGSSSTRKLNLK
jgi:hypothetical protein